MENKINAPKSSIYQKILTHRLFYIGMAALLGLIFLLQNNRPVTIDFFFWTLASANLLVLLLVFFALGALAGFFGREIVKYRFNSEARRRQRGKASFTRHSEV